eukprot:m.149777 g.149777  ORF g.149777 m.149777 type:complete len:613 (+) comp20645_c0_seq1:305-2143(+)
MTPQQALERYRRVLTTYEQEEILQYPHVYFLAPLAKKIHASESKGPNFGYDDDKGRYKCVKNDHIGFRYEILKGLGKGSFGDVVKTYDHKTKAHVALKIIRNEKRFHKQGQIEVKILEHIRRHDRSGASNVIHIADWFLFRNHLCITFELLHTDLYSALKLDNFKGYPLLQVQRFAYNILSCLKMLRRQRIIHCDLKPENILLCSKSSDDIKVIDFGSACYDTQRIHSYIQSRFYRSPEVILGAGYGLPIDMWSLGCILSELLTGHPLFPGHDEKEQLLLQMEVLGLPPAALLARCKRSSIFFDSQGQPRYLVDRKGRTRAPGSRSLARAAGCDDPEFLEFLAACLRWDPDMRATPREAASLPFIASLGLGAAAAASASDTPASSSLSTGAATAAAALTAGAGATLSTTAPARRVVSEGYASSSGSTRGVPSKASSAGLVRTDGLMAVATGHHRPQQQAQHSLAATLPSTASTSAFSEYASATASKASSLTLGGGTNTATTTTTLPKINESPATRPAPLRRTLSNNSSSLLGEVTASAAESYGGGSGSSATTTPIKYAGSSSTGSKVAAAGAGVVGGSGTRRTSGGPDRKPGSADGNPSRLPRPASHRISEL